jgi:hypothetical protein
VEVVVAQERAVVAVGAAGLADEEAKAGHFLAGQLSA